MFAAVGATGVIVHLVTLRLAIAVVDFTTAQALATAVAITSNFIVNNVLTYRDRRLRGIKFVYWIAVVLHHLRHRRRR